LLQKIKISFQIIKYNNNYIKKKNVNWSLGVEERREEEEEEYN
jgi:hypothetical protein